MDVGDAYLALGEHKYALHYYGMLHGDKTFDNVPSLFSFSLSVHIRGTNFSVYLLDGVLIFINCQSTTL